MTGGEEHPCPSTRRVDRRAFLSGGLLVGAAAAVGALGVDPVASVVAATRRHDVGPYRRFRQPNILVVMVDQLRSPRWFGDGRAARLPANIAQLARSGVSFERHYTASNDCTPARAALLTGLHTHQTGCMITGASTLDPRFPTWGAMLRRQGYATYWYGKWHLTHADRHWDQRTGAPGLERYGFAGGTFPSPDGAPGQGWHADPLIVEQFKSWFHQLGGSEPWCTTVSLVNPHDIAWWWRWSRHSRAEASATRVIGSLPPNFETPAQLKARRKPTVQLSLQDTSAVSFGAVPFAGQGAHAAWVPFLDLYVKLQRQVDQHVGQVMATLASRPRVLENTIVVFTSDHGEYGASHGLRGKGAGMYEEAINVPLIVTDYTRKLGVAPNGVRHQLTSSVDVAPLLLTLASGSPGWREEPHYAQIAGRPDLARIMRDPAAPGREYALHATDEAMTEFALLPYAADAPLHVTGVITHTAKYATYANWRPNTLEPLARSEEAELYDHTSRDGMLEIANLAGRSRAEHRLRATLERAIRDELHEPLPAVLGDVHRGGVAEYHRLAAAQETISERQRLRELMKVVEQLQHLV